MKRRFIAGAVCPRCSEMDKTVMYDNTEGQRVRECVHCGHIAMLNEQGHPQELPTRVNQPRAGEAPLSHEDAVSIVRVLDPRAGSTRRDH